MENNLILVNRFCIVQRQLGGWMVGGGDLIISNSYCKLLFESSLPSILGTFSGSDRVQFPFPARVTARTRTEKLPLFLNVNVKPPASVKANAEMQ